MITKTKSYKTWETLGAGMKYVISAMLFCSLFAPVVVAQEKIDETPRPYVDKLNGFSLLPPKGAILNLHKSPGSIVEWLSVNPKTKNVAWLLRVLRVTPTGSEADIESFARMFAGELSKQKNTTIIGRKILKVSGQDAIAISGTTVGKVNGQSEKIYFRRLWVRTTFEKIEVDMGKPGKSSDKSSRSKVTLVNAEFLLFELVTPLAGRDIADTAWDGITKSLKILDVEKTLTQLKENSDRAKVFLQNLRESKKLISSVPTEAMWYLVYVKDKPVGWVMMQGKGVQRNYIDGVELRLCSMRREPGEQIAVGRQELFIDPKLRAGFWRIYSQVGSGPDAVLSSEEGLLRGNKIVCEISSGKSHDAREKTVPGEVRDILLPKAIGMMLPLLIDVNKHVGYTFAEYSGGKNKFNMRNFTVLGPEWIDVGGKRILATKATDQSSVEAEPAELWLGKDGTVLRCKTANSTIESSTRRQVLGYFPKADLYVREINKLGKQNK